MTTAATNPLPAQPRRVPGHPAPPAAQAPMVSTIDPIKLFKRYWIHMIVAALLGAVLGVGAHVLFKKFYPLYRPNVIFQCHWAEGDISVDPASQRTDEDEMERFMATQVAIMTSDGVLQNATKNPTIQREAPTWTRRYYTNGSYDYQKAAIELADDIKARIVPNTQFIEMSLMWRKKAEITAVLGMVRESYESALQEAANANSNNRRSLLEKKITDIEATTKVIQQRRDRLLKDASVESIDQRMTDAAHGIELASAQLSEARSGIEALAVQLQTMEEQLKAPGGIVYSDEINAEVEANPIILNIKQQINEFNAQLRAMQRQLGPDHRNYKAMLDLKDSYEQTLENERERVRRDVFNRTIDSLRRSLSQIRAQEADATKRIEEYKLRLGDLTRIKAQFDNYQYEIDHLTDSKTAAQDELNNLEALSARQTADRVTLYKREQIPNEIVFPKIYIMVPLGVILVVGLFGTYVLLHEVLDQRVKGPSDITLIPRMRLIGLIPHAAEDLTNPEVVETAFRDNPTGILAENYRQVRATLLKRMQQAGHTSLLIVAGHPSSGASTIVANLADACVKAEQRVLVIDANFRRPAQHGIFGLNPSPGLSDVLAKVTSFEQAVQRTSDGVAVLTAGTAEHRIYERLATEAMGQLLAEVRDDFDMVLIDSPPAIVSGDAMAMASRCDATLLVVKALNEKRGLVARLGNQLNETRAEFLGVLVNAVRCSAGGYFKHNIRATHEYQNADAKR